MLGGRNADEAEAGREAEMTQRTRWMLIAGSMSLGACGGGTNLTGDDDQDVGRDDAATDHATADDAAVDDGGVDARPDAEGGCSTPVHWELQSRTITEISNLGIVPAHLGAAHRLRAQVQLLSSCEFLARVDVAISPGGATDFVVLAAWAWVQTGVDCLPVALLAPWNVTIPGRGQDNPNVLVTDGHSPGGGVRLTYEREPACFDLPECVCGAGDPPGTATYGSECTTDCSCAEGLSCIGNDGMAGESWNCLRPCNDFLDCAEGESCPFPAPDAIPWVCESYGDQCSDAEPCPDGFTCRRDTMDAPNRCMDERGAPTVAPCACDADCLTGERCTIGVRATPTCEIPCGRNVECPGRGDGFLVCGTASVCVPLEG
jgi:hypothetical protein